MMKYFRKQLEPIITDEELEFLGCAYQQLLKDKKAQDKLISFEQYITKFLDKQKKTLEHLWK